MRYLLIGLILALSLPAWGDLTRTSSFSYDPNTGLLTQEVIEPDNAALRLQTDYVYDSFGNKKSVTVSGVDIVTRTSTTTYDTRGQFPTSSTNALGHTETRVFNASFGTITSLTGPNGLTTTWSYDGFGRKVLETRADTTQTTWAYNASDANCSGAAYSVTTTSSGAPNSGACYDILNREIRSYAQGFDSTMVYKDTQYDSLGRVSQVSRPYYAGGTPKQTSYTYDALGRVITATEPDNSQTATSYNGLTTTLTDANGHTTIRVKNSQGQLIQVTDHNNGITSYTYDPFGNLTQTTDAKGNITTLAYDIRGRKTNMADPDMGNWSYQYNVLGELTKQTDAKLQVTTLTYDVLGRIKSRGEPDLYTLWFYDTAAKGIGKLTKVASGNGYVRTNTYDAYGRISRVATKVDTTYNMDTAYDAFGRVLTTTYPTGFAVKNTYNAQGYLAEVRNAANDARYWQGTAKDAEGHVTSELLGNGLTGRHQYDPKTGRLNLITVKTASGSQLQYAYHTYDVVGNLVSRFRLENGQYKLDTFDYDALNRLTSYYQASTLTQSYQYDEIGNITYKSDQGFYTYGTQPHAASQVIGPTATLNYTYDANGNMLTGAGRTVTWNSFNMAYQVTQGTNTLTYLYDADHARIKETGPNGTTVYLNPQLDLGGHLEKITKPDGSIEYKHYLYAGGQSIGVYTTRSTGQNDTRYFHTDHLGSISVITDEAGSVVGRYGYEPFGTKSTVAGTDTITHHGFTGHEHMEEVGLVNMNGRVYDPQLARFMSADPNIQAPGNGQSFNRYSYVMNNPLSYTDPSGFSWWTKFRDNVLKPVVGIGAAFVLGPGSWYALTSNALANSIIAGAVAGGIATGNNQGALAGGVSGGLFNIAGGIGYADSAERYAAHAFAGCAGGEVGGGGCGRGAASAVAGKWATNATDGSFVATAVAGGTVSVIGGGKFANGAMTSSFGYLFNYCAHNGCFNRRFDWNDAVDQWRNGNGSTVTDVKASELNLTNATYAKNADGTYQIHTSLAFDTGAIYGTVTGVLNVDGTMSIKPDTYNFDFKKPWNAPAGDGWRVFRRDVATAIGLGINGFGSSYDIEFTGSIPIPKNLPR